jgi:hypothetical protein
MDEPQFQGLRQFYTDDELKLFKAKRDEFIDDIGEELIQEVVFDILTGRNVRTSTETFTRSRISRLNLALMKLFLNGSALIEDFVERLPELAMTILSGSYSEEDALIATWILGLTGKGIQNILRDSKSDLDEYTKSYLETSQKIIEEYKSNYGELTGTIKIGNNKAIEIDWLFILYLLNFSGSQTLTVRGSEKSLYGKFFEKLVLGSLLHILGFSHVEPHDMQSPDKIFWLSSSSEDEQRESDATLIYAPGKGMRFDIGFIGRGNTEISLDKVSRYNREIQLGATHYFMGTIIIVDRIGGRSKIQNLANKIDGHIIQMSASYWPRSVANHLKTLLGYDNPIADMNFEEIEPYLKEKLSEVPLMDFIRSSK